MYYLPEIVARVTSHESRVTTGSLTLLLMVLNPVTLQRLV